MAEIERAQVLKLADLLGQTGELVLRDNQNLKLFEPADFSRKLRKLVSVEI